MPEQQDNGCQISEADIIIDMILVALRSSAKILTPDEHEHLLYLPAPLMAAWGSYILL